MNALIRAHLEVYGMSLYELLRMAHLHKHKVEAPVEKLRRESREFEEFGRIPSYLTDYMVEMVGDAA